MGIIQLIVFSFIWLLLFVWVYFLISKNQKEKQQYQEFINLWKTLNKNNQQKSVSWSFEIVESKLKSIWHKLKYKIFLQKLFHNIKTYINTYFSLIFCKYLTLNFLNFPFIKSVKLLL